MKKLIITLSAALALLAGSWSDGSAAAADWSSSRTPSDGCAKVALASKFSTLSLLSAGRSNRAMHARRLCGGGGWPAFMGNAYGICTWDYGPGASPRIVSRPC